MTALIKYDAAKRALAEAVAIDEAKDIRDKAEALRIYAMKARDIEMQLMAAQIAVEATIRLGELSAALESAQGNNLPNVPRVGQTKRDAIRAAGLSKNQAHRAEIMARVPKEDIEAYFAKCRKRKNPASSNDVLRMVSKPFVRKEKHEKIKAKAEQWPTKKYNVIYADPPWQYHANLTEDRRIDNQYPTMPLGEIKSLPISDIAADDCILFLWATSAGLEESLTVLNAWGFQYRSSAVWVKDRIGAGQWFRQQHETLLLGIRGEIPVPAESKRHSSVFVAPRGEHSKKPDSIAEFIESAYGDLLKIELFCRRRREGWDVWGFESQSEVAA